jgi:hypothetical protein
VTLKFADVILMDVVLSTLTMSVDKFKSTVTRSALVCASWSVIVETCAAAHMTLVLAVTTAGIATSVMAAGVVALFTGRAVMELAKFAVGATSWKADVARGHSVVDGYFCHTSTVEESGAK